MTEPIAGFLFAFLVVGGAALVRLVWLAACRACRARRELGE